MGGIHFYCGKWLGQDKSANPIFEVVDELQGFVTAEDKPQWQQRFMQQWNEQQQNEEIAMTPEMLQVLVPPAIRFRDALVERLGLSGPNPDIEEFGLFPKTESDDEKKYWCLRDILAGNEVSQRENRPLMVHYC
jgi:hypothetical protein